MSDLHLCARALRYHIGVTSPVSFDWSSPGLYALLGPNGAGKSTLLRLLAGVISPISGSVTINDRLFGHIPQRERAQMIAYLPQEAPVVSHWTAREVVEQGLTPHRDGALKEQEARAELQWLCERLKITALLSRRMDQLSGGERRRILITRTLCQCTPILLLDEPLASLDWPAQEEVMELLSEVSERRGAMVVISLHNLNLAWLFAQRSALLARGALVAEGETSATLCAEQISESFGAQALLVEHPKELVVQRLPQRTLKNEGRS